MLASMRLRNGLTRVLLLASLVLAVVGCPAPDDAGELEAAFQAALQDAATVEPNEICRNLQAIVDFNPDLEWNDDAKERRVLVTTWTSWTGYDGNVGQTMQTTRDVWIVIPSELECFRQTRARFCVDPVLRVEQVMGLPPDVGKTRFVQLWVAPDDLFRPSPDPEITDQEAELDFPTSPYVTIAPSHVQWFNDLLAISYGEGGYPWTRLGYTYDWGNPACEVGLSEFVIRVGALVEVNEVETTEQYLDINT